MMRFTQSGNLHRHMKTHKNGWSLIFKLWALIFKLRFLTLLLCSKWAVVWFSPLLYFRLHTWRNATDAATDSIFFNFLFFQFCPYFRFIRTIRRRMLNGFNFYLSRCCFSSILVLLAYRFHAIDSHTDKPIPCSSFIRITSELGIQLQQTCNWRSPQIYWTVSREIYERWTRSE